MPEPTLRAPLAISTPWGNARLDALRVLLPDRRIGWFMRSDHDCLRAAVATLTQIRYDNLPALSTLGKLIKWANVANREVTVHHDEFPVDAGQWIGVTPPVTDGAIPGYRHTVVMEHDHLYHDPAMGFVFPNGQQPAPTTQLEFGLTLLEKRSNA